MTMYYLCSARRTVSSKNHQSSQTNLSETLHFGGVGREHSMILVKLEHRGLMEIWGSAFLALDWVSIKV